MISNEILFRGFHQDEHGRERVFIDGKCIYGFWVYGYAYKNIWWMIKPPCDEVSDEAYTVIPETVSQYTLVDDVNEKRIFVGDIVKFRFGGVYNEKGIYVDKYQVVFFNAEFSYGLRFKNGEVIRPFKKWEVKKHNVVVIGNIFDNPELLDEGGKTSNAQK